MSHPPRPSSLLLLLLPALALALANPVLAAAAGAANPPPTPVLPDVYTVEYLMYFAGKPVVFTESLDASLGALNTAFEGPAFDGRILSSVSPSAFFYEIKTDDADRICQRGPYDAPEPQLTISPDASYVGLATCPKTHSVDCTLWEWTTEGEYFLMYFTNTGTPDAAPVFLSIAPLDGSSEPASITIQQWTPGSVDESLFTPSPICLFHPDVSLSYSMEYSDFTLTDGDWKQTGRGDAGVDYEQLAAVSHYLSEDGEEVISGELLLSSQDLWLSWMTDSTCNSAPFPGPEAIDSYTLPDSAELVAIAECDAWAKVCESWMYVDPAVDPPFEVTVSLARDMGAQTFGPVERITAIEGIPAYRRSFTWSPKAPAAPAFDIPPECAN